MFLQRNVAGQTFTLPGSLRAVADGSAVTTGASLFVQKDGADAVAAGTLTHVSGGAWSYTPTAGETDCKILGFVLAATGAVTVCGSIRTTNADPNDGQRLGQVALPAAGTLAVKPAVTLAAADVSGNVPADVQTIKTQAVTAAAPVTFPGTISSFAGGAVASVTGAVGSVGAPVTVGGYSAGQDPGTYVLVTPARKIATDASNRVTALDSSGAAFTYSAPPAASVIAAAVWDQTTTGHTTAGTFGAAMSAAGSAGDPWATALPGGYSAGQAGYILGTNLDAKSSDTRTRVLLALPAAAPGASNGLVILGTNAAGVTLQPAAGDALKLSAAGGYAINARGSTGSTLAATGLGSAALTCTPGTGGVGIASDIQGDLLGGANILYQTAVVTAATSTTVTLSSPVSGPPSTTPGAYVGGTFWVKTGTGSRQVRTITAYDSVNRIVTVDRPWDTAPDATSIGQILTGQEYARNAARAGDAMALAANAVTAASVAAGALDGKGDWNTVAPDNAGIAAIEARTGNLPASPAATGDIPTANQIADATLRRTMANVEASATGDAIAGDSSLYGLVQQAKASNTTAHAGKLTVFKTDGTTELAQRTLASDPAAEPVTGID